MVPGSGSLHGRVPVLPTFSFPSVAVTELRSRPRGRLRSETCPHSDRTGPPQPLPNSCLLTSVEYLGGQHAPHQSGSDIQSMAEALGLYFSFSVLARCPA